MADIVTYSMNELMQEESYNVFLYVLQHKKEFDNFEKKLKQAILTELETKGLTEYEDEHIKVTYKKSYMKKGIDTEKLKEQGLYEAFVKETPVSASVSITVK